VSKRVLLPPCIGLAEYLAGVQPGTHAIVELLRIWGIGEEKCGILIPGGFDGQISTDLDPLWWGSPDVPSPTIPNRGNLTPRNVTRYLKMVRRVIHQS